MKKKGNPILKKFLKKNLWLLVLVTGIVLLSGLSRVGAASYVKKIVDILAVCQTNGIGGFFPVVAVAAIVMIMYYITRLIVQILCEYLSQKLAVETRVKLIEHLAKIPFRQYEEHSIGNLQSILRNDVSVATEIIYIIFARLVANITLAVLSAGFMISVNARVGIVVTLITLGLGLLNNKMLHTFKEFQVLERKSIGELTGVVESSCQGMDTIKTYGAKGYMMRFFKAGKERYNHSSFASEKVDTARLSIYNAIQNICMYGTMLYLGFLGIKGEMSIGQVVVFITVLRDFMMPVEVTLRFMSSFVTSSVAWGRVYDLLNIEIQPQGTTERQSPEAYQSINELEVKDIRYSYDNDKYILDGFNIKLQKGQSHVLMGESGCGKSTFLKLLVGLYDGQDGAFLVDGCPADKSRLFRSAVLASTNDPLFGMSIYDNITLGNGHITKQACMDLAKDLGMDEWICSLPDGLDTMITEGGKNISGGQRQMIINMRALLSGAAVVILDEPTSALDKQKEALFSRVIDRVKQNHIVLITSHRTDMINYCDKVFSF